MELRGEELSVRWLMEEEPLANLGGRLLGLIDTFTETAAAPVVEPAKRVPSASAAQAAGSCGRPDEAGSAATVKGRHEPSRRSPEAPQFSLWEQMCTELTSQNPGWPEIFLNLSSEDPLDHFECTVGFTPFVPGQIITVLPD